jgi:hypothetical protein
LPIFVESYFPDTFGDTGTLQGMTDLESRPLAEMADIKHKSTNLSLTWTAEDTADGSRECKNTRASATPFKGDPGTSREDGKQ